MCKVCAARSNKLSREFRSVKCNPISGNVLCSQGIVPRNSRKLVKALLIPQLQLYAAVYQDVNRAMK